jgi:hypothetical protein
MFWNQEKCVVGVVEIFGYVASAALCTPDAAGRLQLVSEEDAM